MWRHDAGRTGVSEDSLPSQLHVQWTRTFPAITPAFRSARLQFDRGHEPVVLGEQLFVALSQSDCVVALSTRTGAEQWRYYMEGPVRLAPVAWNGNVYFGSDDGYMYCVAAADGTLRWCFQAVPSTRKVLGNGRLISLWPVRGGAVLADGILYFAAGVWPFEGIFIYALDAETGKVIWRNDRTGYLFGQQPHGAVALGGLTPQGYLLINGDDLVVPCGTARPAVLDRHTGTLKEFSLPGEGRFPGGWFMALDSQEAQDIRRGKVVFDSEVNRERHEGGWHTGTGLPGLRTRIVAGEKTRNFTEGMEGVTGEIHTMLVADDRLFVVTLEGMIYCFGAEAMDPIHHPAVTPTDPQSNDTWTAAAARILAATGVESGYAVVLGSKHGRLAEELVAQSDLRVIALTDSPEHREKLHRYFDHAGIAADRLAVLNGTLAELGLPPYLASLVVAEDGPAAGLTENPTLLSSVYSCLQPYGGVALLDIPDTAEQPVAAWLETATLENATITAGEGYVRLDRKGALPGAVDYSGEWASPDERVGAPMGILWFDDALMHFKRAPQPLYLQGVMISRDKAWKTQSLKMGPPTQAHVSGTGCFVLEDAAFMDVYTGRLLSSETALARIGEVPAVLADDSRPPYQYRPAHVDEKRPGDTATWPFQREVDKGEMINPMTGQPEARRFIKSYGCDGGNDYGHMITMRSATPAFYDKRIESGTINISGPRSGCTNSVIPANGLLNIPYFYDGCSCSYPLPVGAALVRMPQSYEQWTAWGSGTPDAIQRVGINFGAPGDRMTEAGTLWLDHPSIGGPSPTVSITTLPETPATFYQHSLWMEAGQGWPWVCASGVVGLSQIRVNGLREGRYTVRLYFAETEQIKAGDRVFDLTLQGNTVVDGLDIMQEAGGKMRGLLKEFTAIEISDQLQIDLTAQRGGTVLCGIELVRDGLRLDTVSAMSDDPS